VSKLPSTFRFRSPLAVTGLAVTLAACSGSGGPSSAAPSIPASHSQSVTPTPSPAARPTPHRHQGRARKLPYCVSHFCRSVHHADLDGDGRKDRIEVVAARVARHESVDGMYNGTYHVHVRLATRQRMAFDEKGSWHSFDGRHPNRSADPYYGAARLDSEPGSELVLGTNTGASEQSFDVLAWRAPYLVHLPAPDGGDWYANSSAGTGTEGFSCDRGEVVYEVVTSSLKHGHERTHGVDHFYRWRDGAWAHVDDRRFRGQTRGVAHAVGWAGCHGLPKFGP
jgi:hypothetical protein